MNFGQLLTAMVTPFTNTGEVDFQKTTVLVNHLLNNGTDGIVVAGTTGESPTLTTEEKVSLFQHVVEVVNGRAPVIAGTGSNNTYASIQLTKQAELAGVDGVMLVTPYYNKPNQEGMYQHFKTIAESTKLPVMLYNIPGRSAAGMTVETIVRLSSIPNIVCIKEASGSLDQMAQIIHETPEDFTVYSGDDGLTIPLLSVGGLGIVSVSSHIIGNEMQEMITSFKKGDIHTAASIHRELLPIMKALFAAPNPVPVKTALAMTGLNCGSVRLPMVPLNEEEYYALETSLQPILRAAVS